LSGCGSPVGRSGGPLCGGGVPIPGQQLVERTDVVIVDADEDVGEPGMRIDIVELCGLCRLPNYAEWF